jgi:predicted Zn-dependent peptidase
VGGDENSIGSISRDDITRFHESHFTPENTILAAVGDFSTAEMQDLIEEYFGAWPRRSTPDISIDEPLPVSDRRVLLVDKPDSTQTYFYIGNLGVNRTHPDRVPIGVVNTFFGGRFTSRLNTALRVESGLTYGAGSRFELREHAGPFLLSSYTRNDTTEEAIDLALRVLETLHEEGIAPSELESVKTYIKGQFPTRIETSDRLASTIAQLEFYGLDAADIDNYYAEVDAVSIEDVRRVIQEYFPLDDLVFVLVGKASEIESVVGKYGPTLDTKSIREPGY